ncbi:MAG: hypothetical protein KIT84_39930 [Labilithrix sp.]|nr:hypothetical protein [Labilithrix sp.]MCW5817235.1 hypothetical protein [Labilithrix sp.]
MPVASWLAHAAPFFFFVLPPSPPASAPPDELLDDELLLDEDDELPELLVLELELEVDDDDVFAGVSSSSPHAAMPQATTAINPTATYPMLLFATRMAKEPSNHRAYRSPKLRAVTRTLHCVASLA